MKRLILFSILTGFLFSTFGVKAQVCQSAFINDDTYPLTPYGAIRSSNTSCYSFGSLDIAGLISDLYVYTWDGTRVNLGSGGAGIAVKQYYPAGTQEKGIIISPNPFRENFKLRTLQSDNKIYSFTINDVVGNELLSLKGTISQINAALSVALKLKNLTNGFYVVRLINKQNKEIKTFKLVKIK